MRLKAFLCVFAVLAVASQAAADTLPMPDDVIAFDTPAGEKMFSEAKAREDFFPLSMHFTTQINPAYCGPATMAMVLNASGIPRPASNMTLGLGMFDQENIFTPAAEAVKSADAIKKAGMTLDEVAASLEAHGLKAVVHHAADSSAEEFRKTAQAVLEDSDHFIVVNYLRKAIGQKAGGHISPLGAYDAATDRFLILDVSRYKYPPAWVRATALFDAMNTPDSDNNNQTRGYIVISR